LVNYGTQAITLCVQVSKNCLNDLSGTWEGDWVKGNTKNGEQDISADRYVTTIMQV
jgi:hypothetical protein